MVVLEINAVSSYKTLQKAGADGAKKTLGSQNFYYPLIADLPLGGVNASRVPTVRGVGRT